MKIYIDELDMQYVGALQKVFAANHVARHRYTEVYSKHGIYRIDGKRVYRWLPQDRTIEQLKNYVPGLTLLVDSSLERRTDTNMVDAEHVRLTIQRDRFQRGSLVQLTTETIVHADGRLTPYNVYFEPCSNISITESAADFVGREAVKQEIGEFLSEIN